MKSKMRQQYIYCLSILLLTSVTAGCQSSRVIKWPNGAKAALCLTYDDGLPSHVNTVVPMLNKYKLKGTFFPTLASPSIKDEMSKWKSLVMDGHELGNHSIYHPCRKSEPGMEWVKDHYDLDHYTTEQIVEEIKVANSFLQALDGNTARTFAYPCGHFHAGGVSFKDSIGQYVIAARDASEVQKELPSIDNIDLFMVPSWAPNGHESKDLIAYIEKVLEKKTLSTFTFHGVGAEHLSISKQAHEEMLKYLAEHRDEIWVTTFKEAADYLKSTRQDK
jgi:peptidoglycan-N-acetylglucosamine deacetylase